MTLTPAQLVALVGLAECIRRDGYAMDVDGTLATLDALVTAGAIVDAGDVGWRVTEAGYAVIREHHAANPRPAIGFWTALVAAIW